MNVFLFPTPIHPKFVAGFRVRTRANWHCIEPPMPLPAGGLRALHERLHAMKLELTPATPPETANLVLHSEGVLRDAVIAIEEVSVTASAALHGRRDWREALDSITRFVGSVL